MSAPTKIAVTGAAGLIGWHAHARLHAANCAARFRKEAEPYEIVALDRTGFNDDATLEKAVSGAASVLHFAGINRASDDEIAAGNPGLAERLLGVLERTGSDAHVVYSNSTHAAGDTVYGRSKAEAARILSKAKGGCTNLILPHIFGEDARPHYNNVTATFIDRILAGETPEVNPDGIVQLLHAGAAAQTAIDAGLARKGGDLVPEPRPTPVPELLDRLIGYHAAYEANIYPDLSDPFDVALFNSYRAATYPEGWPRPLKLNTDARGTLFEAVKGGGGGQTFLSTTEPGVTRGDHFHLNKVERFLVVEGQAVIRIRKVLSDAVWEYEVSGDAPAPVDMPTLHTHSIENTGDTPLLTLFWTHDLFDPQNPDTFADKVLT